MTHPGVEFGPRLIGTPAGALRSALVARPSPRIEQAAPLNGEPGAIFGRAAEQHSVLVRTLRYFGVDVEIVEPYGEDPLCAAVADAAVVFESGAMLMRPTRMSRRNEAESLATEFARIDVPLAGRIDAPGLLDGTDVLLVGRTAFVGAGTRGNAIGRAGFASVARAHGFDVVEVRLAPGTRALSAVAGVAGERTVVIAPEKLDASAFEGFETITLPRGEEAAAGVLCLGDRHVIADVRYRTALQRMRRAGITVEGIDLYEFEKLGLTPSMLVLPLRRD